MECNGCKGKGWWVEAAGLAIVYVCPLCHGVGWLQEQYTISTDCNPTVGKQEYNGI